MSDIQKKIVDSVVSSLGDDIEKQVIKDLVADSEELGNLRDQYSILMKDFDDKSARYKSLLDEQSKLKAELEEIQASNEAVGAENEKLKEDARNNQVIRMTELLQRSDEDRAKLLAVVDRQTRFYTQRRSIDVLADAGEMTGYANPDGTWQSLSAGQRVETLHDTVGVNQDDDDKKS